MEVALSGVSDWRPWASHAVMKNIWPGHKLQEYVLLSKAIHIITKRKLILCMPAQAWPEQQSMRKRKQ
jgi:hypothetical protein